jgi:hypothetical protein
MDGSGAQFSKTSIHAEKALSDAVLQDMQGFRHPHRMVCEPLKIIHPARGEFRASSRSDVYSMPFAKAPALMTKALLAEHAYLAYPTKQSHHGSVDFPDAVSDAVANAIRMHLLLQIYKPLTEHYASNGEIDPCQVENAMKTVEYWTKRADDRLMQEIMFRRNERKGKGFPDTPLTTETVKAFVTKVMPAPERIEHILIRGPLEID